MRMMQFTPKFRSPVRPTALGLAITLGLVLTSGAHAQTVTVNAGETRTVTSGSAVEGRAFRVLGTLNVNGANTAEITADSGGQIALDTANVTAASGTFGVRASNSNATIRNSKIVADVRNGIGLTTAANNSTVLPFSRVDVSGSTISGQLIGAQASGGGTIVSSNSHFTGTEAGTRALAGTIELRSGSSSTGDNAGMHVALTRRGQPGYADPADWSILIDNSTVEGKAGPAILLARTLSTQDLELARVTVQNGATLIGGNGVWLTRKTVHCSTSPRAPPRSAATSPLPIPPPQRSACSTAST